MEISKKELAAKLALSITSWPFPDMLEYAVDNLKEEDRSVAILAEWSTEDLITYCYDRYADMLEAMDNIDLQELAFNMANKGEVTDLVKEEGDKYEQ